MVLTINSQAKQSRTGQSSQAIEDVGPRAVLFRVGVSDSERDLRRLQDARRCRPRVGRVCTHSTSLKRGWHSRATCDGPVATESTPASRCPQQWTRSMAPNSQQWLLQPYILMITSMSQRETLRGLDRSLTHRHCNPCTNTPVLSIECALRSRVSYP